MKKHSLKIAGLAVNLLISYVSLIAQEEPIGPGQARARVVEKIEAQRVAFLTSKLDLSAEEAARFWPLYNEFSKKRQALKKEMHKAHFRRPLDEEQSNKAVEDQLAYEERNVALKRNYYEKFKAVLPATKLARLEAAELEFRQEIVRKLKEHRERRRHLR